MSTLPVLVVGAGPTGLALALALTKRGVRCRIVDRNAGPGTASRATVVHARTLELYQQLGLADAIVAEGIRMNGIHLRSGDRDVAKLDLRDMGAGVSPFPFVLCYPQDDHERFLVRQLAAAGVPVEWNTELRSFEQGADDVRAVLATPGGERTESARYLCGCDGAHSTVRKALGLEFPGGAYDQAFYVADVAVDQAVEPWLVGNLADRGLTLMMPIRSTGMRRIIGTIPEPLLGRTDLTFDDVRPVSEALMGVRVARVNWFSTYRVHHRVAARFRVGRAFIAGDAGHIHSPAGGQGMNTGLGDAFNLAWKLAAVVDGRARDALLDSYEPERIAFARLLVDSTDRAFRAVVDRGRLSSFLRTWLMPRVAPALTGLAPVRRTIFNTLSQIRIDYRDSALSEGEAGRVSGGDRLPWVPPSVDGSDDGAGNFAPLASLAWQLHVYGSVAPAVRKGAARLGLQVEELDWSAAAERAGLARDAMYLVRPDGYVALAAESQSAGRLAEYAARLGLRFGPSDDNA
jgi:2-polyprenyl-6-methoxyphenol hydroxylase-like FAD-dependent oxidoreductase